MMKQLLKIILVIYLVESGTSRRVEWADEDTIIVEATREEDAGNVVFQRHDVPFFYHGPIISNLKYRGHYEKLKKRSGRAYAHTCYSALGDQGRCTTFTECFPMLYYTEGESKGQIKHPVLADLLLSTSGPCQPPPLSFRDDFVPFEQIEEEIKSNEPDLDILNQKDLICCPSTSSTAIPPSGDYKPARPSLYLPNADNSMRTTSSTIRPLNFRPVQPTKEEGTPDAVAGFIKNGVQNIKGFDRYPSVIKTPTSTTKPKPIVGQLGHRVPTKVSTTPNTPVQSINDISYSEDDESEEEKKPITKRPVTNKVPVKDQPIKPAGVGNDVSVPSRRKPEQSTSVKPSLAIKGKNPSVDVSAPMKFIPMPVVSSNNPKRPYTPIQDPETGDVYVPVIPVATMVPDDSVVLHNPTFSSPLQVTQKYTPEPKEPKPKEPKEPTEPPPDAVAGQILTTFTQKPLYIQPNSDPEFNKTLEMSLSSTTEVVTTFPTTSERPKLPTVIEKAPCGRLNSSTDPKYPWVAAIKLGEKYICAGSLIDEYHVMTSASCVAHLSTIDIGKLRVYLGERILNTNMDGPTILRKVLRAMRHRGFSITTLRNDIALLKLSLPIPIGTRRVKPVCLPLDEDNKLFLENSSVGSIVGWGSHWNQIQNDVTHESKFTMWSRDACIEKYRHFIPDTHFDDEDMLCAQAQSTPIQNPKTSLTNNVIEEEVETDGSPLIVKDNNGIYQQVGISSWKLGSFSNFPRVLTRVSAYRRWIEKNRVRP